MTNTPLSAKRLVWIVNHRTLMPAELPILRSLGYEVFVPKVIPDDDPGFRSGAVTFEHDHELTIPRSALAVLNAHDFYRRPWSATLVSILNRYFHVVVSSVPGYLHPLAEPVRSFAGTVVARAFGREHPRTYTEFFDAAPWADVLPRIRALGARFVFAQALPNVADVEDPAFRDRAHTVTVPLPAQVTAHSGTWVGGGEHVVLLCPGIGQPGYYREIYDSIKRDFGYLPHRIFGNQAVPVDDPAVLPYLTDDALIALYVHAPVFVYPSTEPRHVHYSPLEAMTIGTPVLYRKNALIDMLTGGADLAGACADTEEMRDKAERLLAGDRRLADAIRRTQDVVLARFSTTAAASQWASALGAREAGA
jgi:hypothetical protein